MNEGDGGGGRQTRWNRTARHLSEPAQQADEPPSGVATNAGGRWKGGLQTQRDAPTATLDAGSNVNSAAEDIAMTPSLPRRARACTTTHATHEAAA